ncbi:MAG: hypothetical protein K8U57_30370 [Planctomycetes bacterium]|nr:hypothetical protein [Planctomycetota bacterium]
MITKTDGNVIHADFGKVDPTILFSLTVSCQLLYADELVAVSRLTYTLDGQQFVQHVVTEARG